MNLRLHRLASQQASALLVVLWSLIVLSAAIFAWARWIQQGVQIRGYASQTMEARAMAHSGIAVGRHQLITKQSPQLDQSFAADLGFRVRLVSEGGKINVRWLLGDAESDPRKMAILKLWLERKGLNFQQREHLVDCLLDYIDQDNLHRLNGAEDEGDYHPANRMLLSVNEIAAVKGSGPLVSQPGWDDELTMDSAGPIDLLAASPAILRLIPGMSEPVIAMLLQFRQGPDKLDGTADDPDFNSKASQDYLQKLGAVIAANSPGPSQLFMFNDPHTRLISEGRSGKVVRQVEAVVLKNASQTILSWKE